MKMNLRIGWLALAAALSMPTLAAARLPLTFDHASFRIAPNSDSAYTEFYYGVNRDSLSFKAIGDTMWAAAFETYVIITDTSGHPVDSLRKWVATKVNSAGETRRGDVRIFDVVYSYLPAGDYDITLRVTDVESKNSGSRSVRIKVPGLGQSHTLALSDIQLAYHVRPVDDTVMASPKVKNGYFIEPNPSALYVLEDSSAYFYAELYNISDDPPSFAVHVWLLYQDGSIAKDLGVRDIRRPGESALLTQRINVTDLNPGQNYILALEVDHGGQTATAKKSFALQSYEAASASVSGHEEFTEEDAKFNRHFIAYIATPDELKEYDALSLEAKHRFILDFWKRHDPDPSTPRNEFYQEHARRFAIANERFSRSVADKSDGWNTDRGRIFILYGPPDEIIYSPSSIASLPWERWEYRQLEGGTFFIFLDEFNLGLFRLVHSNKQGELQDPNWEEKLEREGINIFR